MTLNPEIKQDPVNAQAQVDSNMDQVKPDTNLNQQSAQTKEPESAEDPNWRAFREARKKDRAEREAAEKRAEEKAKEVEALKAAMEAAFNRPTVNNQDFSRNQYDNQQEDTEDQRIEKKVQQAIAAREKIMLEQLAEKEMQEYPQRLNQTFTDFNQTIAQENLDWLDYHYPEVSKPLQRLPNGYDKWADIYRAVKKFVPNNTTAKQQAAKADANFNKPKSISSMGMTQPTGEPASARLSEERKQANWERMQKTLKGVGG